MDFSKGFLALAVFMVGCSGSPEEGNGGAAAASAAPAVQGLSEFELAHGIGPVKEKLTLAAVDQAQADVGKNIFESKCASCHKFDEKYVGPELGTVLERRTPEFVMNMILNPAEMVQKHPEAQKKLAEHFVVMPFQNVSHDEARALVEYIRTAKQ